MEPNLTYTLRQDLVPFTPKGEVNFLPNARFFQYDNFDQAFLKMYQTHIAYYDETTAKARGLPYGIKSAMIYADDPTKPLASIRHAEPFDIGLQAGVHIPNKTLYIDKGDTHELLSPALRLIIEKSKVARIEFPHWLIGVYTRDHLGISGVREVENDYLYGMLKDSMAGRFQNPFNFEITSKSIGNSKSLNVEDGALMNWHFALPTLRAAMLNLLTLDFDRLESVQANSTKNPGMITNASVADRVGGTSISYIRHITDYIATKDRPDAGMYLQFNNWPMRYLVETQIPEIAALAPSLQQNSLLIASPDRTGMHFTHTPTAEKLIRSISNNDEQKLHTIRKKRVPLNVKHTRKNTL